MLEMLSMKTEIHGRPVPHLGWKLQITERTKIELKGYLGVSAG